MKSIVFNRTDFPLSKKQSTLTLGSFVSRTIETKRFSSFHSDRLVEISEDLEELDLDENVIGHVCGNVILEALKSRKESKMKIENYFSSFLFFFKQINWRKFESTWARKLINSYLLIFWNWAQKWRRKRNERKRKKSVESNDETRNDFLIFLFRNETTKTVCHDDQGK